MGAGPAGHPAAPPGALPLAGLNPERLRGLGTEELVELAADIRRLLVSTLATTGGHLGSNLGVVELTLALHRVFRSPEDAIVWDTGHQPYIHKLVTGRAAGGRCHRWAGGGARAHGQRSWLRAGRARSGEVPPRRRALRSGHRGLPAPDDVELHPSLQPTTRRGR